MPDFLAVFLIYQNVPLISFRLPHDRHDLVSIVHIYVQCCSNLDVLYFFHHVKPDGSNSNSVVHPVTQQLRSAQPYSKLTNRSSEEDE